jgi:hypothetical protein
MLTSPKDKKNSRCVELFLKGVREGPVDKERNGQEVGRSGLSTQIDHINVRISRRSVSAFCCRACTDVRDAATALKQVRAQLRN